MAIGLASAPAIAQTGSPPGTIAAPPTREEISRLPPTQATPPSRLSVTGGIERAACALDGSRFQSVTVTLEDVIFDDLKGFDPAALRPAFAPYLGKTVPIGTVCEIRDAASTILRNAGYVAAVEIPPQRISGGVLHLTALMARLVAIHVRGQTGRSERLLGAYLQKLVNGQPFTQHEAERNLLLAGDLPGYDVRLALRPAGTTPGEVIGDVTVTRIPFDASVNIQNYGSHALGRWSGQASAEINDLIGLGDRAVFGFSNTFDVHEQSVVQSAYEVRPGSGGLVLAGRFTYAWTRPDIGAGDPLRARTLVASAEASYPLVRRQDATVRLVGGLDVIGQKLRFGGAPLTDDQLRVLYGRIDFSRVDPRSIASRDGYNGTEPRWSIAGSLELRHGLGGLGASGDCGPAPLYPRCAATPSLSRFDADPQATLVRISGDFAFRPVPKLAFVFSPRAQYAFDPLLSYEQYSVGTYTIGRGFDPGALIGDSGVGFQAEVRAGTIIPSSPRRLAVQPFGFVDAAWVWTRGPLALTRGAREVLSVGGGLRAALGNRARLEMTLAEPIPGPDVPAAERGLRLLVSFTTRLWPF